MRGTTKISFGSDGVAVITIINPPVNSLTSHERRISWRANYGSTRILPILSIRKSVLNSLKESFGQALQRDDVKAIVVIGEKRKFCGGFDLNALYQLQEGNAGLRLVHDLSDIMESARKPSVAAINGRACGAGLEVAMACNARVATSTAQLSLPELRYGIIPGGGGTQRLPRLVGLRKALELLLTSKPVDGDEAHKFGLVDAVVSGDELLENARQMALDICARNKPLVSSLYKTDKIEPLGEAREILKFARAQTRTQPPNLQHPQVCIDVIEEGIVSGPDAGLSKERKAFQDLLKSDTCKSLVHVFFARRDAMKVPGVTDLGLKPREIRKVAIVGGGPMGSRIAMALILNGYEVVLKEVTHQQLTWI
ncbi:putative isomerase, Enoyl-CoA hydratase, 3-hydroxyacyl-CoA dehydrogenase [Helianthus annuus]|nr:putative isomerase, Enoyl-CoA hydratase, 3-hydroxyacyl-CoA dehydrogenase [Helianthus annuus]